MSWYKISQDLSKIQGIAAKVRSGMATNDDDALQAMCLPASRKVVEELGRQGINAIVVQGTFTIDNPDPSASEDWDIEDFMGDEEMMEQATYTPLHYWAEVLISPNENENLVVDITASQFNDELDSPVPAIQIGTYSQLGRYTPIQRDWI